MKNFFGNRFFLILLVLLVLFGVYTVYLQGIEKDKLKREKLVLEKEIERLEKVKKELIKEIDNSNSAEYMERAARTKLNMVKPDEILFYVSE